MSLDISMGFSMLAPGWQTMEPVCLVLSLEASEHEVYGDIFDPMGIGPAESHFSSDSTVFEC